MRLRHPPPFVTPPWSHGVSQRPMTARAPRDYGNLPSGSGHLTATLVDGTETATIVIEVTVRRPARGFAFLS